MSLATPAAAPRSRLNLLPLYIIIFCLLWSSGFVPSKIGVTDCPPLIFLTVRFLIAGALILAISALRGEKWNLSQRGRHRLLPDAAAWDVLRMASARRASRGPRSPGDCSGGARDLSGNPSAGCCYAAMSN
jgi:hypothetical protein